MTYLDNVIHWTNENSGFLSLILFVLTLLIAWVSGLFNSLTKKPKFKIRIIEQCTFGTTLDLKREHNGYPVTKTAFAIYVEIINIGTAPSSIGKIKLGYIKSDFTPRLFSKRNWIKESIAKDDFTVTYGDSGKVKVFPFLKQRNSNYQNDTDTYLPIGRRVNGIVYFEQYEAYGSWIPRLNRDGETTNLKIKVKDSFGGSHTKTFNLALVEADTAFKFNAYFGQTEKEYFNYTNESDDNESKIKE